MHRIARFSRGAVLAAAIALPACAYAQSKFESYPEKPITFIAQAAPGSGFDQTTRAVASTLEKEGLIKVGMPVINTPSSAVGAQTVATRHVGDPYMMSFNSISLSMRHATGSTPYSHRDFTPIARLTSDYYIVAVRPDSKLKNINDFLDTLRANPKAFPIAGGQSDDRIFYGLLFSRTGIDPAQINYIAFSGGGEASTLLLEGSAGALITTVSDVAGLLTSGKLRGLAISGSRRFTDELSNIPTLKEQGVDLEWQNFRYAMGGKDMPKEVVKFWQDTYTKMVKTDTWKKMLARNRWGDEFLIEGFPEFLDKTQAEINDIARKIGMAKG